MASNNIALASTMNKDTASVNDQVSLKCQADTIMSKYESYVLCRKILSNLFKK